MLFEDFVQAGGLFSYSPVQFEPPVFGAELGADSSSFVEPGDASAEADSQRFWSEPNHSVTNPDEEIVVTGSISIL